MSTQDFLFDLGRFAMAADVKDAVEHRTGRRPGTKADGLADIERALDAASNRHALREIMDAVLVQCRAQEVIYRWCRDILDCRLTKGEAVDQLIAFYLDDLDEDEDNEDDLDEDDDDEDDEDDEDEQIDHSVGEFILDLRAFAPSSRVKQLVRAVCGEVARTLDAASEYLADYLFDYEEEELEEEFKLVLGHCSDLVLAEWCENLLDEEIPAGLWAENLAAFYIALEPDSLDADEEPLLADFEYDPDSTTDYEKRDYQQELVRQLVLATERGRGRGKKLLVHVATGGGKTHIANNWLAKNVAEHGARVLWVSKGWELLRQAASDLCRRHEQAADWVGRLGGKDADLPLPEDKLAHVVYTTIHTWERRRNTSMRRQNFDYIVIDELHWGEGKPLYSALSRRYGNKACFVGLTATPRRWTDYELVGARYGFPELLELGYLAKPRIQEPRRTGVSWSPRRSGRHGDFTPSSLQHLASEDARNSFIVDAYRRGADDGAEFGKTLVFAINIQHAEILTQLFRASGYSAELLHHRLSPVERRSVVRAFRTQATEGRSRVDILVNVEMMTHGVDIPDIQTVFLARPTASDILFSQMVGRGARLTKGKTAFNIVDFVDNMEQHGDVLVTGGRIFGGPFQLAKKQKSKRSATRPARHFYEPAPIQFYPGKPGYEEIQGLEYQPSQTFGIEFELTRPDFDGDMPADWQEVATALLGELRAVARAAEHPTEDHHGLDKDDTYWNVDWDGTCGWEVTSPILVGEDGLEQVMDVCRRLDDVLPRLGLCVNYRTGTHVHLGWKLDLDQLSAMMQLVAGYEPALMSLVSPSRAHSPYAEPIRKHARRFSRFNSLADWRNHFEADDARYLTVNPANLFGGIGTLEIRMHNGTYDGPKILTWLSLWMRLAEAVERGIECDHGDLNLARLPLCRGNQGDVLHLAALVSCGSTLRQRLEQRREHVVENSWLKDSAFSSLARRVQEGWR